jgi:hypothetical protein
MRTLAGIVSHSAERRSRGGQTDVIAPVNRAVATNIGSPGGHRVAIERQHVTVEQRGSRSETQASGARRS